MTLTCNNSSSFTWVLRVRKKLKEDAYTLRKGSTVENFCHSLTSVKSAITLWFG